MRTPHAAVEQPRRFLVQATWPIETGTRVALAFYECANDTGRRGQPGPGPADAHLGTTTCPVMRPEAVHAYAREWLVKHAGATDTDRYTVFTFGIGGLVCPSRPITPAPHPPRSSR